MTIYSGFTLWKWWFPIVMLVYQRVHTNRKRSREREREPQHPVPGRAILCAARWFQQQRNEIQCGICGLRALGHPLRLPEWCGERSGAPRAKGLSHSPKDNCFFQSLQRWLVKRPLNHYHLSLSLMLAGQTSGFLESHHLVAWPEIVFVKGDGIYYTYLYITSRFVDEVARKSDQRGTRCSRTNHDSSIHWFIRSFNSKKCSSLHFNFISFICWP
jgi:hypothetical protein